MSEITRVDADLAKRVIEVAASIAPVSGSAGQRTALARDKLLPWCAQLPAGYMLAIETAQQQTMGVRSRQRL